MLLSQATAFYRNYSAIIINIAILLFEKAIAVALVFFVRESSAAYLVYLFTVSGSML